MVQPSPAIATRKICKHCGGTLLFTDDDGRPYCAMCCRPYTDWQGYGALGGQATLAKYGREYMVSLGRRGGRPRQQAAPKIENKVREGMAAQPNNLKVLKELWRERREELLAASSSSQEVNQ